MVLWVVALLCAGLFALGWWVSRPVGWLARWVFRVAVLVMLLALAVPPAAIEWVRDALSGLIPLIQEAGEVPGLSYLVHFTLFTGVSGLLFWTRPDLGRLYPGAAMVVLAFVLEGLQLLIDGRFASWGDVAANLLGVTVAAVVVWSIRRKAAAGA